MRFVFITSEPLYVVAHTTVDVTMEGNTFFPISFTVLIATVLIVFGDFQHCCIEVSVSFFRKLFECFNEEFPVPGTNISIDIVQNIVSEYLSDHIKGEKVTSTFSPLMSRTAPEENSLRVPLSLSSIANTSFEG